MSLLFLLPSAGYGLYLYLTQGNAILLFMSAAMVLVYLQSMKYRNIPKESQVIFLGDRVYLGDIRLPLLALLWPSKIRNQVFEAAFYADPRTLLKDLGPENHGVTVDGVCLSFEPSEQAPHGIIIGPTGCGKTQLMRSVVNSFKGQVWAVDFKGGAGFRDFHNLEKLASEQDASVLAVEITQLLQKRQAQVFGSPILVVVDELGEVMRHRELAQAIELIAAKGRSLGVFLLCANQTLSQVPRTIWVNCAIRIAIKADSVDAAQLGLKVASSIDLPEDLRLASADLAGRKTQFYFQIGREINTGVAQPALVLDGAPNAFPLLDIQADEFSRTANFRL